MRPPVPHSRSGSVLIGVLWCVVLLAVLVVGLLHTTRIDLMAGKYHSDRIQAHYLALAGIEKAKALLYQDALDRGRAGVHHGAGLYNSPEQFRDVSLGRGQFRVVRAGSPEEGGGVVYGVSDEEGRLNINVADVNQLTNILELTSDIAAAIVDWRDSDHTVSPGGAEAPYYASIQPPYVPRNGPFQTLRELLMVRGVSAEQLSRPAPGGDEEALSDTGWSSLLTAHSTVENVDASGAARINVQNATVGALTGVRGITRPIADAIIAHRGANQIENLVDLLEVRSTPPNGQNRNPNPAQPTGPTLIDQRLFGDIADHLTVEDRSDLSGAINVNSASVEVLMCLPGLTRPLAQAVVAHRKANGFYPSVAALLEVPGLTREILKPLLPLVTTRSETFRILSEGRVGARGTRQRIEAVVHVGLKSVSTLAYREDDL